MAGSADHRDGEATACRAQNVNGFAAPDDFAPSSPHREDSWAAMPDACKEYLCRQKAQLDELHSFVEQAWAARFTEAHAFKVMLLQRAHNYVLQRLRDAWDGHRSATDASKPYTIYSLDTNLLEHVLALVPGQHTSWDGNIKSRIHRRGRMHDAPWLARRACAQVCRLFEALTYLSVDFTHHSLGEAALVLPPGVPAGALTRDIERTALSTKLTSLDLFFPMPSNADAKLTLDSCAAVAAIPRCPALTSLRICVVLYGKDEDVCVPNELIETLPLCKHLKTLTFAAYDYFHPMNPNPWLGADEASMQRLLETLAKVRTLERFECESLRLSRNHIDALERQHTLTDLRLIDITSERGWLHLAKLTHLTNLDVQNSYGWNAGRVANVSLSTQLQQLQLQGVHLAEAGQLKLADALPEMSALTHLLLGLTDVNSRGRTALMEALPKVVRLASLTISEDMLHGTTAQDVHDMFAPLARCQILGSLKLCMNMMHDPWVEAVARVLPQCRKLAWLTICGTNMEWLESESMLAPVFAVLPAVPSLCYLEISNTPLSIRDVAEMCAVLGACKSLTRVLLRRNELDATGRKLAVAVSGTLPNLQLVIEG